MVAAVPLNIMFFPERLWFLIPMLAWMALLAVHGGFALGRIGRRDRGETAR